MKKFLLPILFASSQLIAGGGIYLGGSVGGTILEGHQKGTAYGRFSSLSNPGEVADLNADLYESNWLTSLYAGYGQQFGFFYGAIEGFAQYSDASIEQLSQTTDLQGFSSGTLRHWFMGELVLSMRELKARIMHSERSVLQALHLL